MKRFYLPLFLLLLVACAVASFRIETRSVDRGESPEARLNPWLAAGRLLERQGLRVRTAPQYGGVPAHAGVIVLATPLDYLDNAEQDALLAWVRQGGHLVSELTDISASTRSGSSERLAAQLDVRLLEHDFSAAEKKQLAREKDGRPTRLDGEGTLQAGFTADYFLAAGKRAPAWSAGDRYGPHAMRFATGRGRITLLSDLAWLGNDRLGEGDHGALLWRVVDAAPGSEVWLIPGIERPSLLAVILEKATPLVVAISIFALAWLWSASRRFGPLAPLPEPARRRLAEHLEASGRYLMRHGGLGALHNASRERLLARVHRRHPQWRRLATPELAQRLAERARIEPAAVQRLLQQAPPQQLLPFAADIRLINRLRKAL